MTSLACPSSLMCSGRPGRRRSLQRNRELNPRKQVRNREEVASEQGSVEAPSSRRVEPGATRRSDARGAIVASRSRGGSHEGSGAARRRGLAGGAAGGAGTGRQDVGE